MIKYYIIMNNHLYYCVIGVEFGLSNAKTFSILGTFTNISNANDFIKSKKYSNVYTIVDIIETYIDKENIDIENVIHL